MPAYLFSILRLSFVIARRDEERKIRRAAAREQADDYTHDRLLTRGVVASEVMPSCQRECWKTWLKNARTRSALVLRGRTRGIAAVIAWPRARTPTPALCAAADIQNASPATYRCRPNLH